MSYRTEWIGAPLVVGVVLLPLIVPPIALILVAVLALAAAAAVVALAGAVLATPYLVVRHVRRHLAERRPTEGSTSITPAIAPAELPGPQLG